MRETLTAFLSSHVGLDHAIDIAVEVNDDGLHTGTDRGKDRADNEAGEHGNDPDGHLIHQPAGGHLAFKRGVHGADTQTNDNGPDISNHTADGGDQQTFSHLIGVFRGENALIIHLVGHAARRQREDPEKNSGETHAEKRSRELNDLRGNGLNHMRHTAGHVCRDHGNDHTNDHHQTAKIKSVHATVFRPEGMMKNRLSTAIIIMSALIERPVMGE